jgi:hypothetical protein
MRSLCDNALLVHKTKQQQHLIVMLGNKEEENNKREGTGVALLNGGQRHKEVIVGC